MAAEERASVKTSVPQYQKDAWQAHADTLDMTQSEFVRTMVQAGRRGFEVEPPETPSPDANPGGSVLREPVLDALSTTEYSEFDEVVEYVVDQLDALVEETIDSLENEGAIDVSARRGVKLEGEDGDG
jgi:hypothetical protein